MHGPKDHTCPFEMQIISVEGREKRSFHIQNMKVTWIKPRENCPAGHFNLSTKRISILIKTRKIFQYKVGYIIHQYITVYNT